MLRKEENLYRLIHPDHINRKGGSKKGGELFWKYIGFRGRKNPAGERRIPEGDGKIRWPLREFKPR